MAEGKKFSTVEIIIVTPIVLIADGLTFLANLAAPIPVIGEVTEVIGVFIGFLTTVSLQFYLFLKGVKNLWVLVGGIVDSLPIANILPTLTIGWLILLLMENGVFLKKVVGKFDKGAITKIVEKI